MTDEQFSFETHDLGENKVSVIFRYGSGYSAFIWNSVERKWEIQSFNKLE